MLCYGREKQSLHIKWSNAGCHCQRRFSCLFGWQPARQLPPRQTILSSWLYVDKIGRLVLLPRPDKESYAITQTDPPCRLRTRVCVLVEAPLLHLGLRSWGLPFLTCVSFCDNLESVVRSWFLRMHLSTSLPGLSDLALFASLIIRLF